MLKDGVSFEQNSDRGNFTATYSGAYFYIDESNVQDIPIEDIAHALSLNCRFNGHIERFYSVAEHSVLVSRLVSKDNALWGLLHDASEAFVPDMPRPFKVLMPQFKEIEERILKSIVDLHGLPWPMPDDVKYIDTHICADEANELFRETPDWTHYYDSVVGEEPIIGLPPGKAERLFLSRYEELTNGK